MQGRPRTVANPSYNLALIRPDSSSKPSITNLPLPGNKVDRQRKNKRKLQYINLFYIENKTKKRPF